MLVSPTLIPSSALFSTQTSTGEQRERERDWVNLFGCQQCGGWIMVMAKSLIYQKIGNLSLLCQHLKHLPISIIGYILLQCQQLPIVITSATRVFLQVITIWVRIVECMYVCDGIYYYIYILKIYIFLCINIHLH